MIGSKVHLNVYSGNGEESLQDIRELISSLFFFYLYMNNGEFGDEIWKGKMSSFAFKKRCDRTFAGHFYNSLLELCIM